MRFKILSAYQFGVKLILSETVIMKQKQHLNSTYMKVLRINNSPTHDKLSITLIKNQVQDDQKIYLINEAHRCPQDYSFRTSEIKASFGILRMKVSVRADSDTKEAAKRREASSLPT